MTKIDIYEGLIKLLIDSIEYREQQQNMANSYINGALDMCMTLIDKINEDGEAE